MGVTDTGVRWPEPTAPVAQGALDMRHLAEDQTARGPVQYPAGVVTGPTLSGTGGTLGAASGLTVPAAVFTRLVAVRFVGTLGTCALWVAFTLLRDGVQVATARCGITQTPCIMEFFDVMAPGAAHSYSVNMTSSAAAGLYTSSTGLCSFTARSLGATTGSVAAADPDHPNQDLVDSDAA